MSKWNGKYKIFANKRKGMIYQFVAYSWRKAFIEVQEIGFGSPDNEEHFFYKIHIRGEK